VDQSGADQFTDRSLGGVPGIASVGIGVEDEGQLVHRQPGRVFIEEKRQDGALGSSVFPCRGRGIV
jgi:hypothetical protein